MKQDCRSFGLEYLILQRTCIDRDGIYPGSYGGTDSKHFTKICDNVYRFGGFRFSDEERGKFTELLEAGFTDSFRWLYPDRRDAYSWWSYRAAARERNVGWRIDYFVISDRLRDVVKEAYILPEIMGSDHCPVGLDLDL